MINNNGDNSTNRATKYKTQKHFYVFVLSILLSTEKLK